MSHTHRTQNHEKIKKWVKDKGGVPAKVVGTTGQLGEGILRIYFREFHKDDTLKEISWDEFFEIFDHHHLTFLYQDEKDTGEESTFNKFLAA